MADLSKRIVVRVTDEQLAWIGEAAVDEGMDNATFVRVVIDRLSKGRAPLIGMMAAMTSPEVTYPVLQQRSQETYTQPESTELDAILASRVADAEAALPDPHTSEVQAAIPFSRVERQRYNPQRS